MRREKLRKKTNINSIHKICHWHTQPIRAGFTLIEMLLVIVVIGMILLASVQYLQLKGAQSRIDRTTIQMQQILNAGLAYYIANGNWPEKPEDLMPTDQTLPRYLTGDAFQSPWGIEYQIGTTLSPKKDLFSVYLVLTAPDNSSFASSTAKILAGSLPMGYTSNDTANLAQVPSIDHTCGDTEATCSVVASVNLPGQDLNERGAVRFANLYRHGGCVPAPNCPTNNNSYPQIMVVPAQVSGNLMGAQSTPTAVYPISQFTAYAVGLGASTIPTGEPAPCVQGRKAQACGGTIANGKKYWHVCLKVVTEAGTLVENDWAQQDNTLLAITRCTVPQEDTGSDLKIYEP